MKILCLMLAYGVKLELLLSEVVAGQLQKLSELYRGLFTGKNVIFHKHPYHKTFGSTLMHLYVKTDLFRNEVPSSASFFSLQTISDLQCLIRCTNVGWSIIGLKTYHCCSALWFLEALSYVEYLISKSCSSFPQQGECYCLGGCGTFDETCFQLHAHSFIYIYEHEASAVDFSGGFLTPRQTNKGEKPEINIYRVRCFHDFVEKINQLFTTNYIV